MAARRLGALNADIPDSGISVLIPFTYAGVMIVLAILSLKTSWIPTRRQMLLGSFALALGTVMEVFEGAPPLAGYLVASIFYPFVTLFFFALVASLAEDRNTAVVTLGSSIAASALVVALCLALSNIMSEDFTPIARSALDIAAALSACAGLPIKSTYDISSLHPLSNLQAVSGIAAITACYLLCSVLYGITVKPVNDTSPVSLLTYLASAALAIALLAFISRASTHSGKRALLTAWPFALVVLVIALVSFSASIPLPVEIRQIAAFAGLALFYFGAWILCPILVCYSNLPFVAVCAIISVFCYGYPARMLGTFLATSSPDIFTVEAVGVVTVFALVVALIAYVYHTTTASGPAHDGRSSRSEEQAKLLTERFGLSEREREVCELALEGYAASRISEKLFISENTVRFHLKNIYRKCNVPSKQMLLDLAKAEVARD